MKTIKYIIIGITLITSVTSCTLEDTFEEQIVVATGDDADDPADPDEEGITLEKEIDFLIQGTGEDADDPADPEEED